MHIYDQNDITRHMHLTNILKQNYKALHNHTFSSSKIHFDSLEIR